MTTKLYDSVDVALPTFTFLSAVPAYLSVRTQDDVVCRLASAHSFLHFSSLVPSSSFFLPYTISPSSLVARRSPPLHQNPAVSVVTYGGRRMAGGHSGYAASCSRSGYLLVCGIRGFPCVRVYRVRRRRRGGHGLFVQWCERDGVGKQRFPRSGRGCRVLSRCRMRGQGEQPAARSPLVHEVCVRRTWHGMCCLRTYLPATARSRCVSSVCTIDRVIHFASPVHHAQRRRVRFDRQHVGENGFAGCGTTLICSPFREGKYLFKSVLSGKATDSGNTRTCEFTVCVPH